MVLSLFHTYCRHSYRKKTKQMVINNLPAISHVFGTSNIPILHVFEVLAKKLRQKKSSIERAAMAHARCLSLL